jgi:hypothetical protein
MLYYLKDFNNKKNYYINKLNDLENSNQIKFNYSPLRIGEFHDGTFGSLVRLLPIFEEYSPQKEVHKYNYVWIDDIDILTKNLNLNDINKKELKGFNTYFLSIFCYYRPWIKSEHNYNMNFPLVTNIKLSMKIMNKFLDDIVNNKFNVVIERILKFRPSDAEVFFSRGECKFFLEDYQGVIKDCDKAVEKTEYPLGIEAEEKA